MGRKKYITRIQELFERSPVVSFASIKKIIQDKKNVKQYTKQFIRNQLAKEKIKQLTKGFYTIHEDPSLIVYCLKPAYFGLQNALSYQNLWEQETIPLVLTTRKIRQGIRTVLGLNVMLRRIDKRYFFGFDYLPDGDFYFPVSDIEKTFVDLVYYKCYIDPEVIKEFKRRIDKKKLHSYLEHYPERFRKIVLARLASKSKRKP